MSVIQHELELVFPATKVPRPVLCEMFRAHDVVFNVVSANVSQHRGHFHFLLLGTEQAVKGGEEYLRREGIEVRVVRSEPFAGTLPPRPHRMGSNPSEPRAARKLWLTYLDAVRDRPVIWEMACRFDVCFDIRQSSVGKGVNIMAILLEGPSSHVDAAIEFLREMSVEVEPIEKSVIEG
jgi:ABC-type methionine transport system ATPase subunit